MSLTTVGLSTRPNERILGRISREPVEGAEERQKSFALLLPSEEIPFRDLAGYRGLITSLSEDELPDYCRAVSNRVTSVKRIDHLQSGDVIVVSGRGNVRTLYRPNGSHNFLFATDRCNSNCLMCSQPPKDKDDSYLVKENLELIDLIPADPDYLVITGGEPTLLGDGLFKVIRRLRDRFPETSVLMLSNGRRFARPDFAEAFAELKHQGIRVAVPLYADYPQLHDYIVQARHAYEQTVVGLHNLARNGISVEIRVVLHALTIPRLNQLVEFIYRTFPFVDHVALMGLEMMGYTKRNMEELWIDPYDYQSDLERAVTSLALRGVNVSIYNLPLCVLDRKLWGYSRNSISDWKNIYLEPCTHCSVRERCGGFFASATTRLSSHISAVA